MPQPQQLQLLQQLANLTPVQPAVVQQPQGAAVKQPAAEVTVLQQQQRLQQLQPLQLQVPPQPVNPPAKTAQPVKPVLLVDKPVKTEEVKTEMMDVDDAYDDVLQVTILRAVCTSDEKRQNLKSDAISSLNIGGKQA